MKTGQEKSIVDQLLSAVNEEDCSIACYTLSSALEAANDDGPLGSKAVEAPVVAQKGWASSGHS